MTTTKTADVEGTLAADLRAGRRRRRHRALHLQRDRGGRGPGPHRAPLAGADRRRHPPPVPAWRSRRSRPACTACGSTPATSASPSTSRPWPRECKDRGVPDPHRRQRRLARPRRSTRSTAAGHPRGDGRVGPAGARLLRRGRLRRRQDLGQGVERAADDRGLPPARPRPPTTRCTSASPRPARRRPGCSRPPPASPRCSPRASATPSATRSPPIRSRRPAPAASCSRRWACASARASTSSPARRAAGPRST